MDQSNPESAESRPGLAPARNGLEPWFVHTVGILLLVIIAALAGLTLRLHQRARLAEARLAEAWHDIRLRQAELMLKDPVFRIFGDKSVNLMIRPPREGLPRTAATLDGQPVEVLELGAVVGGALGLRPGDILRVADPAGSRPATAPAAGHWD